MKKIIFILLLQIFSLSLPLTANTLSSLEKKVPQLVEEAGLILLGTVEDLNAYYMKNGGTLTHVTLEDITIIKGNIVNSSYTLEIYGGQIGNESFDIPGAPTFFQDRTYILFIKNNKSAIFPFVGGSQGQFTVTYNNEYGITQIFNSNKQLIIGIDSNNNFLTIPPPPTNPYIPLENLYPLTRFIEDIEAYLP